MRITFSAFTLYMILILLRWFGPRLSLDVDAGRLRWIAYLTDPLIGWMRRLIPPIGPFDVGPLAALLAVWLARELAVTILV